MYKKALAVALWNQNTLLVTKDSNPSFVCLAGLNEDCRINIFEIHKQQFEILLDTFNINRPMSLDKDLFIGDCFKLGRELKVDGCNWNGEGDEIGYIEVEILGANLINIKMGSLRFENSQNYLDIEEMTYSGAFTVWWGSSTVEFTHTHSVKNT
jgi:hypothetical protein